MFFVIHSLVCTRYDWSSFKAIATKFFLHILGPKSQVEFVNEHNPTQNKLMPFVYRTCLSTDSNEIIEI